MSDHDHGPFAAREFKRAALERAKRDIELDEMLEDMGTPLGRYKYRPSFRERWGWVPWCLLGFLIGNAIILFVRWMFS